MKQPISISLISIKDLSSSSSLLMLTDSSNPISTLIFSYINIKLISQVYKASTTTCMLSKNSTYINIIMISANQSTPNHLLYI